MFTEQGGKNGWLRIASRTAHAVSRRDGGGPPTASFRISPASAATCRRWTRRAGSPPEQASGLFHPAPGFPTGSEATGRSRSEDARESRVGFRAEWGPKRLRVKCRREPSTPGAAGTAALRERPTARSCGRWRRREPPRRRRYADGNRPSSGPRGFSQILSAAWFVSN